MRDVFEALLEGTSCPGGCIMRFQVHPPTQRSGVDRFLAWCQTIDELLNEGMNPALILVVLFEHWFRLVLVAFASSRNIPLFQMTQKIIDEEKLYELEEELEAFLRYKRHDLLENEDSLITSTYNRWYSMLKNTIQSEYPKRIFHERDITRFVEWLYDELEEEILKTSREEGKPDNWLLDVFKMWYAIALSLDRAGERIPNEEHLTTLHREAIQFILKKINMT